MMQEDISSSTIIKYHFVFMYVKSERIFVGHRYCRRSVNRGRQSLGDPWGTNFFSNSELS